MKQWGWIPTAEKMLITLDPSNWVTLHQLKTTETQRDHTHLVDHANSPVLMGQADKGNPSSYSTYIVFIWLTCMPGGQGEHAWEMRATDVCEWGGYQSEWKTKAIHLQSLSGGRTHFNFREFPRFSEALCMRRGWEGVGRKMTSGRRGSRAGREVKKKKKKAGNKGKR